MKYTEAEHSELEGVLKEFNLDVLGYDPEKSVPIRTKKGRKGIEAVAKKALSDKNILVKYPEINKMTPSEVEKCLEDYLEAKFPVGVIVDSAETIQEKAGLVGHYLARDILKNGDVSMELFVVNAKDVVSDLHPDLLIKLFHIENPYVVAKSLVRAYEPRESIGTYDAELPSGEVVRHINKYIPPTWPEYSSHVPDKLPDSIETLFNQIINPMDRLYFLHWLYLSIATRATTYLVLQGDPGVGKNIIKLIVRALHGHNNSGDGNESMLNTKFNTKFRDVTYIHFDELDYDKKRKGRMKEIPNGSISYEGKGVDATRADKIFCSAIITNNYPKDNYITFDDRKFAPMTLSQSRLEDVIPPEEIAILRGKVEDPGQDTYDVGYIAQIGRWILNHGYRPDLFPQGEYRGPKFWELAHSSMSGWQKVSIEVLLNLEIYSKRDWEKNKEKVETGTLLFSDIKKLAIANKNFNIKDREFPRDYSSAEQFIKIFRGLNGEKVFEVRPSEDKITGDFYVDILSLLPPDPSSLL